jgi:hypothetical protein
MYFKSPQHFESGGETAYQHPRQRAQLAPVLHQVTIQPTKRAIGKSKARQISQLSEYAPHLNPNEVHRASSSEQNAGQWLMEQMTINTSANLGDKQSGKNSEMGAYPMDYLRNFSRESCTAALLANRGPTPNSLSKERDKLSTQPAAIGAVDLHKPQSSLINHFP